MKEIIRRHSTTGGFYTLRNTSHQRKTSYSEIKTYRAAEKYIPIILVGNKCDLTEGRTIKYSQGHAIAKKYSCPFYEVSAKESINDQTVTEGPTVVREIRPHL